MSILKMLIWPCMFCSSVLSTCYLLPSPFQLSHSSNSFFFRFHFNVAAISFFSQVFLFSSPFLLLISLFEESALMKLNSLVGSSFCVCMCSNRSVKVCVVAELTGVEIKGSLWIECVHVCACVQAHACVNKQEKYSSQLHHKSWSSHQRRKL